MVPPKYFGSCSLICIFPLNAAWQKVPSTGSIRKQHTLLDLDPWLRLSYSGFQLHSNFSVALWDLRNLQTRHCSECQRYATWQTLKIVLRAGTMVVTGIETVQIHPMVTLFTHHFICPCTKATIVAGFGSGNQSFAPHGFIPPVRSQCLCDTTYSARSTRPLTNFQRV